MGKFGYLDSIILKDKEVMKEVKEVVHVPTRELAEEVLRVGAENGLYRFRLCLDEMIELYKEGLCICFNGQWMSKIGSPLTIDAKIITAQEFLNRYKPKFRPIAMKCTQEQFEAVKGKLVGCDFGLLADFEDFEYLSNNVNGFDLLVSNIKYSRKECNNRQVFEEWNEKTFLEYCGISIGVEDSHKDVHVKGCFNTDKYELEQLRKENEELRSINDTLNKENLKHHNGLTLLKEKLKAIEDTPKVGDVCLFWDEGDMTGFYVDILIKVMDDSNYKYRIRNGAYTNCIKATPENIQAKIKELNND